MSDPNNPNIDKRSTPQYALYQRENFWKTNTGEVPPFNTGQESPPPAVYLSAIDMPLTEPGKLEELAKAKLTEGGWYILGLFHCVATQLTCMDRHYASSNAGQSYTHLANRQAFFRHRIIPRQLVDTNLRDTATTIFGHKGSKPHNLQPSSGLNHSQ